jgi:hypothetical protein
MQRVIRSVATGKTVGSHSEKRCHLYDSASCPAAQKGDEDDRECTGAGDKPLIKGSTKRATPN